LHSSLDFEMAFSDVSLENSITKIVMSLGGCHSYLKLRPGVDIKSLEKKISQNGAKYYFIPPGLKDEARIEFYLQPFHDVPFESHRWDYFKVKSKPLLYTLSAVAIVVLVMAWINYINLTLSAQGKRLKEIAVRKTIGSNTKQIIAQFVCESLVINLIAFFTALTLMQLIVIPVKVYLNFDIPQFRYASPSSAIFIFITIFIGILINGVVPIVITLRKNTRTIFQLSTRKHSLGGFSNMLSAIQFSAALILVIWATTAFSQLNYVLNKDLGIRKDNISVIELPREQNATTPQKLRTLSGECIRESLGEETTYYRTMVGDLDNFMICIRRNEASNEVCIDSNGGVDESFIPFFGIKLLAGRNFLPDRPADSTSIIVSPDALARLGINQDEAVGMSIDVNSGGFVGTYKKATIIGIISDYEQRPLLTGGDLGNHRGIILTYKNHLVSDNYPSKLAIRHRAVNLSELSKKIAGIYHREFPRDILKIYTLTDHINGHYADEAFARNQITFFTILAMLIASLGLLGNITNRVHEKKKEVGIRKILGAGGWHVAEILLKATLVQMLTAIIIAFPIASYLARFYIQKFSAQAHLTVYHYVAPLLLMFVILIVTTGSILWRTLKSNPVDALRYE